MLATKSPISTVTHHTWFAGPLLFLMVLCSIVGALYPSVLSYTYPFSALCAWTAALLLFTNLRLVQRIQIGLFLLVGLTLVILARADGADVSVTHMLARNTALVSMLLSVGFLELVLLGGSEKALPTGRKAYLQTLIAVSLFGSIINISAPVIIGDRLVASRPMDLFTARSLSRIFCACATWSPFFAGMAVVLISVSEVRLVFVMLGGLPFLLISIALVYYKAVYSDAALLERFEGYPLRASSLLVPALLAVSVLGASISYPALSILTVISLSAILLTAVLLVKRYGIKIAIGRMTNHINQRFQRAVNVVLLFLAAGVLATGLVGVMQTSELMLPVANYRVVEAAGILAMMIVIAALGIHPVIQISVLTPLLLMSNPQPELLALTYLFGWGLGTTASPLSGTHLVFQGRYGIPAWRGAVQNWSYVLVMYVVAVLLMSVFSLVVARLSS